MAISARDIFLSVRVSDRATRPLRQISSELRRMQGTSAGVVSQRRRLEQQQISNVKRQQRLIDNITSATSGKSRQALNDRILKQREAEARAASKVERAQNAITSNQVAQHRAARSIATIQARPEIDQAARTRLLRQRRTAEEGLFALERRQSDLIRARQRAQQNLARMPETQKRLANDINSIEASITSNLAQQEKARARVSKQLESEVSMAQLRAEAMAPVPRGATPESRAMHLQTRALFEREAVLLEKQRAAESALANFPKLRAAANDKVLASENAILKNQEAQVAAERKIAQLKEQIAVTPTAGRSRVALEKDLQAAQLAQQRLITTSGTLQRDYETAQAAQVRVLGNNQRLIADEQKLARDTALWKTELQATQSQLSTASAEMARLNAVEQAYLKQENLQKWSQRARMIEHLGHVITITGLAATAAFAGAAKVAADFSTQAVLAATQARPAGARPQATARIAERLNKVVLNQMQRFPASADEMSKALYSIFSGTNIQGVQKAARLLRIFNKEAVAGGTDLDTMTQAGITLYNNFPKQFGNMRAAGDRFFAMVRFGRGTAQQFADALSPILPIAKGAGQTFDDVAGTLAFLSRQSKDVTANAQGFARLLLLIARPEVRAGFKRLGIDVLDSQKRVRPLLDIVQELKRRGELPHGAAALTFFKDISQAATGKGTAGTIQAQRAWQRLVEGVGQYRKVSRLVVTDNDEFQASFEALSKSPGVRWKIFTNQLKALVILIGEQAIPAFTKMGAGIVEAVKWFRQLSPHTQRMIGYFGAFAAVATLVGGVLLTVVGGLASVYITIRLLLGNRGLAGLVTQVGEARLGFLALYGSLAGLIILFVLYPGLLHTVTHALGGTANAIQLVTSAVIAYKIASRGGLLAGGGLMPIAGSALKVGAITGYLYMLQQIAKEYIDLKKDHQSFWGQVKHDLRPTPFFKGLASNTVALATLGSVHVWQDAGRHRSQAVQREFNRIHFPDPMKNMQKSIRSAAIQLYNFMGIGRPLKLVTQGEKAVRKFKQLKEAAESVGATRITPSFQRLFAALIRARKLANAAQAALRLHDTPANERAAIRAYNNVQRALANLSANASKEQVASAKKAADDISVINKKQVAKQKDNLKTATDNVSQMYNDLLQQNQQYMGTLFQGPFLQSPAQQAMREWGVMMKPRDLTRDLKSQVFQFQRFEGALNRLRRRGAPPQLIQQLQQLGPEALPQIQMLSKMAPRQFREYIRVFQNGQRLVKQQTMRDLKSQLALYRSYGKNIGRQIVLGIRDQSGPMKGEIRSLVLQMFPELRVRRPRTAAQRHQDGRRPNVHHHVHHHDHDHTSVNVKPGTSLSSELQRDRFRKKHRPRSPRIRR